MMHPTSYILDRRTLLTALALTSAGSLAACSTPSGVGGNTGADPTATDGALGTTGERTGKEILIYMSAGRDYPAYLDVAKEFETKHNVKVTVQYFQWADLQQKLTADFLAGTTPDLVEENGGFWSTRWGADGNIMPLDNFLQHEPGFLEDFVEAGLKARQANGKTYAIPMHVTMGGLVFANQNILDNADVKLPTTWEEFRNAAKKIQQSGVEYGCALNNDYSYGTPWLLQNGAEFSDSEQPLSPVEAAVEALSFQKDLIYSDQVAPVPVASNDYAAPRKVFTSNRAGMIITGPWDIGAVRKEDPDFPLVVGAPLTGKKQVTTIAGSGLMIPSKTQNAELAWEFIKAMTTLEVQEKVTEEVGMAMSRKSWAESDTVKNDPVLSVVANSRQYAISPDRSFWESENMAKIADAQKAMYEEVILNNKDPQDQVDNYNRTVAGLLGK